MPVTISGTTGIQGNLTGQASELAPGGINNRTLITSLDLNDAFLFWDSTDQTLKKVEFNSMQPSGSILQVVTTQNNGISAITTTIPRSTTVPPQITAGVQILSASIIPQSANSKIFCQIVINGATTGISYFTGALFRNNIANALAAAKEVYASYANQVIFNYHDTPNTTSSTIYQVRVGPESNTFYLNQNEGAQNWNASTTWSTLTLMEIKG